VWFYARKGEDARSGPVSEDEIRNLTTSGELSGEHLVWTLGQDDWMPLAQSQFAQYLKPKPVEPPPIPAIEPPPIPVPTIPFEMNASPSKQLAASAPPSSESVMPPPAKPSWWKRGSIGTMIVIGLIGGLAKACIRDQENTWRAEADAKLRGTWTCTLTSPELPNGLSFEARYGIEDGRRLARYDFVLPVPDLPNVAANVQVVADWAVRESGNVLREYPVLLDIRLSGEGKTVEVIYDVKRLDKGNYESTLRELTINGSAAAADQKADIDRFARSSFVDPMFLEYVEDTSIEDLTDKRLRVSDEEETVNCAK
jgi:hypothetical protein